ncbi:MAG: hypothetical protein GY759_20790 [Chloroflexi bacterium]|nr:hypothetical protein [Chloroflexota bacterium]
MMQKFSTGGATWEKVAVLSSNDPAPGGLFGYAVALDGDTIVVGAHNSHSYPDSELGSAYVFEKSGTDWQSAQQVAELTSSDISGGDYFGEDVAIEGDTIVITARGKQVGDNEFQGAAYVFVRPEGGWTLMSETAKLKASDGMAGTRLGASVAIDDGTIVVGASGHDVEGMENRGAAYVFERPEQGWRDMTETARLIASDGDGDEKDSFGRSVGISADTIVVGAPDYNVGRDELGAAYVFEKPETGWVDTEETTKLANSYGDRLTDQAYMVAISNATILTDCFITLEQQSDRVPRVLIYERGEQGWEGVVESATLRSEEAERNAWSADLTDNMAVLGFPRENSYTGIVNTFDKPTSGWVSMPETDSLKAAGVQELSIFGRSVSAQGNVIAVGAIGFQVAESKPGAVFVFVRN